MSRIVIALLALVALAGAAAAQDEPDPFAAADDPFADTADPFAALEANVSEVEESADVTTAAPVPAVTTDDATPAPAAPAETAPAAAEPATGDNDAPGFGVVALIAALAATGLLMKRRR